MPIACHIRRLSLVFGLSLVLAPSARAVLTVNSLTPSTAAVGVCYDTPLYITFNETPKLGSSGMVRIFNATNNVTPVDVVDLSLGNLQTRTFPGDAQSFSVYSVLINGNRAAIYPHAGVMTSNATYFVTVDPEVFTDSGGINFDGITDTNAWRFTTKPTGPLDPTDLVVAADGSGDFVTVQGAVDSVTNGNTTPTVIHIRDGDYVEIVNISGKNNLLFRGQSREGTVVGYANNANIAPGGTTHARMAFKVNGNDISVDNLTITNRTPQGGSQAEALMVESDIKRFIANNVTISSYQDTILANTSGTQGYLNNSLIQGDVDFIWGGGNLFLTNCEIRTLRSGTAITQPRTDQGSNGMSFVKCRLTRSSPAIVNVELARALGYRYSNVGFILCLIDDHVIGWETDYLIGRGGVKNPNLRWWEYGNSNLTATAAVVYQGHQIGVTNNDPRLEAALNSSIWLYGWQPQLQPNIVRQPASQTVGIGAVAMLSVHATGIPDPSYQWQRYGTNVPGATLATLTISNALPADAGSYSVLVSNVAGVVTSSEAVLDVVNQPPIPGITTLQALQDTPVSLAVSKLLAAASDPQGDAFDVSGVSPLSAHNGTVVLSGGSVTYTPPADYVGADEFHYTLTDVPGASTNVAVSVTVTSTNAPSQNLVGQLVLANGDVQITFAGIPGRDYSIQRTDSLVTPNWITLGSVAADSHGRILFTDTDPPAGQAYYRATPP